jgi:hypothetical protein
MSNLTVTNNSLATVLLMGAEFRDELLTFAGAATVLAGTILARDSVSLKLVPFAKGGVTNENGIPKAVVTYDVVATGAGDIAVRAGVSGKFRKEQLIIDADGDGSDVDNAVLDQLRDYSLIPLNVSELNILDNQ